MFFKVEKNQSKPYQKLVNFNLSVLEPDLISICIKIGFEIINIATLFQNLVSSLWCETFIDPRCEYKKNN